MYNLDLCARTLKRVFDTEKSEKLRTIIPVIDDTVEK